MTSKDDALSSGTSGVAPWPLDRRQYTHRLRRSFPSTKRALNEAVQMAMKVAQACGCEADAADVEIALREALANAVIHGNAYHGSKRVFLRCYGAPAVGFLVLVRDEGAGFDPKQVPDPREGDRRHLHHGRGLLLMRELMDHVEYRKDGREVLIFKSCAVSS